MVLTTEQIRSITGGAVRISEIETGVMFHRFTEEQEAYYRDTSADFYKKALAPAGVRFSFKTDSRSLKLSAVLAPGSSRAYYAFDVFVNGAFIGSLDNFSETEIPSVYTTIQLPQGEAEKSFDLGDGEKTVCVYFPWSAQVVLKAAELDNDASLQPIPVAKTLLAFGDSITQGYDALHPSTRYIGKLAEHLGMVEVNKAIGGEFFCPELAKLAEAFVPDLITVAYGTNDWSGKARELTEQNCAAFFENLRQTYPTVPIVAITPIWRANHTDQKAFGPFEEVGDMIRRVAAKVGGVLVVDGFPLVPHDVAYYADGFLHPNDAGFEAYFTALAAEFD